MKIVITNFVKNFSEDLSKSTTSKIAKSVKLLKIFEYYLSIPYAKKISKNIYELRIGGKQKVRIFYTFRNEKIILFHAFIKKTNKIPKRELKTVLKKINNIENI